MKGKDYLEGATPYDQKTIERYTRKGWWLDLTFGDVLDRSAAAFPEKTAVIDGESRITYCDLKNRVDRFARSLLDLGVKKNDRILLQLPNRHEFIVAFYAMQRIGAVPVLAIPRHGVREISHFLRIMEPVGWILPLEDGKRHFGELLQQVDPGAHGVNHVILVSDGKKIPGGTRAMEDLMGADPPQGGGGDLKAYRPDPNDVAVILLTGGTTGLPKGVPRTHNSYLTNIRYTNPETRPEDIRSLATPIGHSMAHQGPVGASILYGATLCLIAVPRAPQILKAIERHRITMITLVPTQLEDILRDGDASRYDLTSLRMVRTAGAALRPETAKRATDFFGALGAAFSGGGFGSSEGPAATHAPDEPLEVLNYSIGRPICEGDHWKAIDEHERELPPNKEGELAARGPSIFTGYFRSDAENRGIFTRDGYYKMGDLGRIDVQGYIYITGRKKDIIQRGGEGIIPGEMEDLLRLHSSIRDAAVVGMPDPRLGEKACAYVTLKQDKETTLEEVVAFLKSQGAGVLQLPEKVVVIESIPTTPVGKPDKEALRADIRKRIEREQSA